MFTTPPKRLEILTIGDELLDGRVTDSNTTRLAQAITPLGLTIARRTSIPDTIDIIVDEVLQISKCGTDLCIVSGGLGPTSDDLTSVAFQKLLHVPMVRDEPTVQAIRKRLEKRGLIPTENQFKQADRPEGSYLLSNPVGTAPGFDLVYENCRFMTFPGVPMEFDKMIDQHVIQPLQQFGSHSLLQIFTCFGLIEAELDSRLKSLPELFPHVRLGFRAKFPEIEITLRTLHSQHQEFAEAIAFTKQKLHDTIFANTSTSLPEIVLAELKQRGETLALAESCSGGALANLLTDIPGSSAVFLASIVSYANHAKEFYLHVANQTLADFGAVSAEVVEQMAKATRENLDATYGLAISGIAGPEGGTEEKPVGTVWLALATRSKTLSKKTMMPFDRKRNKMIVAYQAMFWLWNNIHNR